MDLFESFCVAFNLSEHTKGEQAVAFLWFHCRTAAVNEATIAEVATLFDRASLPAPNITRLKNDFRLSDDVHKGSREGFYRITRAAGEIFEKKFGHLLDAPVAPTITERADLKSAPLLGDSDRDHAKKMAELYVILHCYENSARRLVEKVLKKKHGDTWWDQAANAPMKMKIQERQTKEQKNRWITPRGSSPLFYLDWGELLTLIRKYEADFTPHIGDFKFVELRFEELERFRNIVAHHGVLPSDDEFQAVILSFKHWCRQISPSV
jgi:hypothetical protein